MTALSVTRLSAIDGAVRQLRAHLRAAYVHDAPRKQRVVYDAVCELVEKYVRPYLDTTTAATTTASPQQPPSSSRTCSAAYGDAASSWRAEAAFVTTHYLQDIMAALLFLLPDDMLQLSCSDHTNKNNDDNDDDAYTLDTSALPALRPSHAACDGTAVVPSSHYVSHAERVCCARVVLYLCFVRHAALPAHHLLAALYPLLDTSAAPAVARDNDNVDDNNNDVARDDATQTARHAADGRLANVSVPSALCARRFARTARWLSRVLHGMVRARDDGVRALLRVFVLDDRVPRGSTVDACGFVVRLVARCELHAQTPMWWPVPLTVDDNDGTAAAAAMTTRATVRRVRVALTRVGVQEQARRVAAQLLPLLTHHAATELSDNDHRSDDNAGSDGHDTVDDGDDDDAAWARWLRAQQQHQQQQRLPRETLEERLHLCVSMLIDAVVQLPQRDTHAAHTRAYARLYWYNVYLLTPAFGALSLRVRTNSADKTAAEDTTSRDAVDDDDDDDVVPHACLCAVWRVQAVVYGAVARPAARGAICVLEAAAPGLLCLTALLATTSTVTATTNNVNAASTSSSSSSSASLQQLRAALARVWSAVYAGALPPATVARVLVHASVSPTRYTYDWVTTTTTTTSGKAATAAAHAEDAATTTTTRVLRRVSTMTCTCATRLRGLVAVVYDADKAPAAMQSAVLVALADACHVRLQRARCVPTATTVTDNDIDDNDSNVAAALRSCVEHVCMTASAEAVCGERHVLHEMLTTLRTVAPLSPLCLRWACVLAPRLLLAPAACAHEQDDDDDDDTLQTTTSTAAATAQPSAWLRAYTTDACRAAAATAPSPRALTSPQRSRTTTAFALVDVDEESARVQLQHALSTLRDVLVQEQQQQEHNSNDDAYAQCASATAAVDDATLQRAVDAIDRALVELAAATALAQQTRDLTMTTTAAAVGREDAVAHEVAVLQQTWRDAATQLAWALDAHSPAAQAVALRQLMTSVEEATWRMHRNSNSNSNRNRNNNTTTRVTEQLRPLVTTAVLPALTRALVEADDDGAAVTALRCIAWLAMYRLDAADTSVVAALVHAILSAAPHNDNNSSGGDCNTRRGGVAAALTTTTAVTANVWRTLGVVGVVDAARVARAKARVLDVLLCLCDDDACAQTLRAMDDYLSSTRWQQQQQQHDDRVTQAARRATTTTSLYALLVRCCQRDEAAVVQVAALHLIGCYVVHVHPRVALRDVCALARDVFRHTSVDMAKAACAAMLHAVVSALHTLDVLTTLHDVDLAELHTMATAMASYYAAPSARQQADDRAATTTTTTTTTMPYDASWWAERARRRQQRQQPYDVSCMRPHVLHDEVVRQHGRDMLTLLQSLATHALVQAVADDDDDDRAVLRCVQR